MTEEDIKKTEELEELSKSSYTFDVSVDGKVIPREMLKPDEFTFNRAAPILTQLERLPDRLVIH